jgi:hypothetical protein
VAEPRGATRANIGGTPTHVLFVELKDRGGHFAAWEEPELFSEEIRATVRSLR